MLKLLWHVIVGWPCAHDWQKVTERTEPSPFRQCENIKIGTGVMPAEFFEGTYILVLKCSKCGALDKTVKIV
ncbi:MAG: hypothetical protein ABFE07_28370 [Armatimonadia bacterium]